MSEPFAKKYDGAKSSTHLIPSAIHSTLLPPTLRSIGLAATPTTNHQTPTTHVFRLPSFISFALAVRCMVLFAIPDQNCAVAGADADSVGQMNTTTPMTKESAEEVCYALSPVSSVPSHYLDWYFHLIGSHADFSKDETRGGRRCSFCSGSRYWPCCAGDHFPVHQMQQPSVH
jgi:hypothetical protein